MKLLKKNVKLLVLLFIYFSLFSCSQKPCDKYIGTWVSKSVGSSIHRSTITTIIIKANGDNYLLTEVTNFVDPMPGVTDDIETTSAICQNGTLQINGMSYLTYVKDGDYLLKDNVQFYRKKE